MMLTTKELIAEAMSLPVEERLVLDSLLRSLNAPSESVDKKWTAAAQRRLAQLHSGGAKGTPGDEVVEALRSQFFGCNNV